MAGKRSVQRIVVLVAMVFLTGSLLYPIFLVTYGIMALVEDSGIKTPDQIEKHKVSFGVWLLSGSIVGTLFGVFLPYRPIGLSAVILANWIIVILMRNLLLSVDSINTMLLPFGGTVGLMMPILVMFIEDQYNNTKGRVLNDTFIYMIGCCCLVTSLYHLYTKHLYNNTIRFLNISIGSFVIAFFVLLLIVVVRLFISKRCFMLERVPTNFFNFYKSIPIAKILRLILRNLAAGLLFTFISQLGTVVDRWTHNSLGFNVTINGTAFNQTDEPGENQTRVNASFRYQEGYPVIFLAPVFISFGLESHPTSSLMLACFSILLAAWLWPYLQNYCIPREDRMQLLLNNATNATSATNATNVTTIISYPIPCELNSPIVNVMHCLIIFGKLMLVTSTLIISCRNLETNQTFLAVAICFCCLFGSYAFAAALPKAYLDNASRTMLILFGTMLLNIYLIVYLIDDTAERVDEQYDEMDEIKILDCCSSLKTKIKSVKKKRIPKSRKEEALPDPQEAPEEQSPEEQPSEEEVAPQSVSAKRSSRTSVPEKPKRRKHKKTED